MALNSQEILQQSVAALISRCKYSPTSLMALQFPSHDSNSETLASFSAAPIPKEEDNLYQRLILHAPSTVPILPIIKQWVSEGKSVKYVDLKKSVHTALGITALQACPPGSSFYLSPLSLNCFFI
uniref:Uncharacterized protein LOC104231222 n=1 Tax=Nicotiana sylvestris TaxID=4096 RepID=A0A1U7X6G6_NICSY|nr:PREDICTED: uncharacterized protein LOC104231222 [Nicotiana sylvestris]